MHVQRSKSSSSSNSERQQNFWVSTATQVAVISPSKREQLGVGGATYIHTYIYVQTWIHVRYEPGKTPDSRTFEDINLKKHRRRGFTLKCTASAPGGKLDDSRKNNTPRTR